MARRGLFVDAVEISAVALSKLRALAQTGGVSHRVCPIAHDLDDGLPPAVTQAPGGYDLVVCLYFYEPTLIAALRPLLRPGGLLLVEVPTRENLALGFAAPSARFLAHTNEVLSWAGGLTVRFYREGVRDRLVVATLLAQKPGGEPPRLPSG